MEDIIAMYSYSAIFKPLNISCKAAVKQVKSLRGDELPQL